MKIEQGTGGRLYTFSEFELALRDTQKDNEIAVLKKALELACKVQAERTCEEAMIIGNPNYKMEKETAYDNYVDQAKKELGGSDE